MYIRQVSLFYRTCAVGWVYQKPVADGRVSILDLCISVACDKRLLGRNWISIEICKISISPLAAHSYVLCSFCCLHYQVIMTAVSREDEAACHLYDCHACGWLTDAMWQFWPEWKDTWIVFLIWRTSTLT